MLGLFKECGQAVITCCIFCGLEYDSTFLEAMKAIVLLNSSLEIGSPLLKLPCSSMLAFSTFSQAVISIQLLLR